MSGWLQQEDLERIDFSNLRRNIERPGKAGKVRHGESERSSLYFRLMGISQLRDLRGMIFVPIKTKSQDLCVLRPMGWKSDIVRYVVFGKGKVLILNLQIQVLTCFFQSLDWLENMWSWVENLDLFVSIMWFILQINCFLDCIVYDLVCSLQENIGILTDIPTENEILGISRGISEDIPRIFRGNTKFGFLGICSEHTDGIPRKY
ncbi:hypothetical protein F2Q69_00012377 [Brassica cretica]|uniref:Uncharacterized protein n=1 Tax=Brassica cretica TaxID=69181 RepID=A0A8S9QFM3_BRACR|nr:hypothetical protein F2Q69_00012377 [Brassica cretica]